MWRVLAWLLLLLLPFTCYISDFVCADVLPNYKYKKLIRYRVTFALSFGSSVCATVHKPYTPYALWACE